MSIIKTHYSAKELAEMRLDGLPTTKVNMIAFAKRKGWAFIEIKGRGGVRREYVLPAEVMKQIISLHADGAYLNIYVKSKLILTCSQLQVHINEAQRLINTVHELLDMVSGEQK